MIPFNKLTPTPDEEAQFYKAAEQVIASGWYINGKNCAAFEENFANFTGTTTCVGVANGTDALEIALRSVGVSADSTVATVANAGFYTTTALRALGATPAYIDVESDTHLMALDALRERLATGAKLDAIVVTHLYGLLADMPAFRALADQYGVRLIEDCAQAHGARRDDYMAGSLGDMAAYSFYPTKNLGALGDGGAICTRSDALAQNAKHLKQYGWTAKYVVGGQGGRNSRLDEIQAAFLSIQLEHLDANNARRRDIANAFSQGITHNAVTTPPVRGEDYVGHLYVIKADNRDGLAAHLKDAGIATDIHFPVPDHQQLVMAESDAAKVSLPMTEALAGLCLSLPCHPKITDDEVDAIIAAVNSWAC